IFFLPENETVVDEKGEHWFCAKDVCDALGYNNSRDAMRKHVEIDDVAKRNTMDALGRMQPATFINEFGLYSLILSC
ncbi:MAG: Bro-N domain-containing protein, partial [Bacteroidaceae bacterium]|nr:Bro-N domain-containing protein [Bacteroidaceae bacterium]